MGSAFAKDAAEDLGNGENELAVRDVVADGSGSDRLEVGMGEGQAGLCTSTTP